MFVDSMTEQTKNVESPLRRPHVQWTLAAFAVAAIIYGLANLPNAVEPFGQPDSPVGIEIDLNQAEAHELALIPSVGPVLAARIVSDRERHGEYTSLHDLLRVHGIGPQTLRQIEELCVVQQSFPAEQSTNEEKSLAASAR